MDKYKDVIAMDSRFDYLRDHFGRDSQPNPIEGITLIQKLYLYAPGMGVTFRHFWHFEHYQDKKSSHPFINILWYRMT